jgi:hypothetical protein
MNYRVLQLYKMLFAVIILIYVKSYPLVQIILLLFMQLANEAVLLSLRPLTSPKDNFSDFTTELLTTIYLLFYLLLTDLPSTHHSDGVQLKVFSSWCLVALLFLALLISLSTIVIDVYRTVHMSYIRCRRWRARKYLMGDERVKKEPSQYPFYQGDGDVRPVHNHRGQPLGLIPEDEDEDVSSDDGEYEK